MTRKLFAVIKQWVSIEEKHGEKGQILLVVILTMVVALTVGLSVASRTITNLKIAKQNEESERAFQAAEAGIEQAIKQIGQNVNQSTPINLGNNSSVTYKVNTTSGQQFLMNGGEDVDQDTGLDIWLSDYPDFNNQVTSTLSLYWGTTGQECPGSGNTVMPALEVVVLSGTITNPTFAKYLLDPCGISRTPGSTTPGAGGTFLNTTFQYKVDISVTSGIIAKVIPIYNSAKVGIDSTAVLPSQGAQIDATGTSGDTVRKVVFFSSYPQMPPEIFPYSIISQ